MKRKGFVYFAVIIVVVLLTLVLVGCGGNKSTEYDIVKMTKMDNYELLNETAQHNQVVFIGDSIIELYPTYELFTGKNKRVYNRGISGDTSDRLLERMDKNALK